jgi:hypothetical protein
MNITWEFYNFNVYNNYTGLQNIVYSYNYSVTVSDGSINAAQHGLVRLNFDVIETPVPFEQLTKEIVQKWTEDTIDTQKIIKNLKESVLSNGSETTQRLPAPWAPPATPSS